MSNPVDKLTWKLVGGASAAAAAAVTRKAAQGAFRGAAGVEPPEHPSAPHVPLRHALAWALLSGISVAVVRLLVERAAARAWVRTRGELPPGMSEEQAVATES